VRRCALCCTGRWICCASPYLANTSAARWPFVCYGGVKIHRCSAESSAGQPCKLLQPPKPRACRLEFAKPFYMRKSHPVICANRISTFLRSPLSSGGYALVAETMLALRQPSRRIAARSLMVRDVRNGALLTMRDLSSLRANGCPVAPGGGQSHRHALLAHHLLSRTRSIDTCETHAPGESITKVCRLPLV